MFYNGIPLEVREVSMKTSYNWGLQMSTMEKDKLTRQTELVEADTRLIGAGTELGPDVNRLWNQSNRIKDSTTAVCRPVVAPRSETLPSTGRERLENDDNKEAERYTGKINRKREREKAGVFLEEIAPRETGREAQIEKRREKGAKLHQAAREREDNQDGLDMKESDVFGGGDDFHSMKARMAHSQQRRQDRQQDRARELQEKEQERTANFMSQLGVDLSKGPIKILPRSS
mmetsp:Transcript_13375/g.13439  ORF Transcript_13375/g.13439 Transcript_13375/m.13439 type:complete len:231 (-) Transcript_13375:104-796(-)